MAEKETMAEKEMLNAAESAGSAAWILKQLDVVEGRGLAVDLLIKTRPEATARLIADGKVVVVGDRVVKV